jgi:hypothetical protein
VPDVYPAYLSYDQYLRNRQQLRDNMYNFAKKGRGAPRDGRALLQGLMLCGICGRRMTVSHGREYRRYECRRAQLDYAASPCQAFPVRHLDEAIGAVFLEAVQPAALDTALEAFSVMERERREVDRHWQLRIERARYEAERVLSASAPFCGEGRGFRVSRLGGLQQTEGYRRPAHVVPTSRRRRNMLAHARS